MNDLLRKLSRITNNKKKSAVSALAIIVVFVMTYSLILPAIAMEKSAAAQEPGLTLEEAIAEGSDATEAESTAEEEAEASAADHSTADEASNITASENAAEGQAAETAGSTNSDGNNSSSVAITDDTTALADVPEAAKHFDSSETTDNAVSSMVNTNQEVAEQKDAMPAVTLEHIIKFTEIQQTENADGSITEQEVEKQIKVIAEAEEGTFPEGTTLKAELNFHDSTVQEAIERAIAEKSETAMLVQYQAVDIRFIDIYGNEIEPMKNVEVRITSDKVNEIEQPVLVRVTNHTDENQTRTAELFNKKNYQKIDETEDTVQENENTLKFKTDQAAIYAVAETDEAVEGDAGTAISETEEAEVVKEFVLGAEENVSRDEIQEKEVASLSAGYITADGVNYTVTVTYGTDAGIPAGAELQVNELQSGSRSYQSYVNRAAKAIAGEDAEETPEVKFARLFDISILVNGEKIQPAARQPEAVRVCPVKLRSSDHQRRS